jgi:2-polyprenyl-3-methyl-5-hydroxy-6-metoxy-1,4-benzoquinol methylase
MDQGEEIAAVIAEIRARVRARHPNGAGSGNVPLPDLTPLLHARDAAEAKVASIGTVNPRSGGLKNSIIQSVKRTIARALDWHIREQVEFNRGVMECVQAGIQTLNESRQAIALLAGRCEELAAEARELRDIRQHWAEWRTGWEQKLAQTEIHFLRSVAELQAAFQHRVTLMDANYREQVKAQHGDFEREMDRRLEEIQQRFWGELERVRLQYDAVIHSELRLLRQKANLARSMEQVVERAPAGLAHATAPAEFANVDWLKFAERFRGSEEAIRARQKIYPARFREHAPVLDLGCGRGEMLEVFREAGIPARGVDANGDSVAVCQSKGLDVEKADVFVYLSALPDGSLDGAVCCQVVEHLPPARVPELIAAVSGKLRPGGVLAIETPNPECLAIFASHFYLDPTHRHPIPPALAAYYMEEAGLGLIQIERLSPAIDSMPALAEIPEGFRQQFFGSLDYAAFGVKLG